MNRMTLIVIVFEVILAAVGLAGGWWFGMPILEDTRVDLRSGALALAATVPLLAFVYGGMRTESGFGARLQEVMRDSLVTLVAGCSVFELLIISIMAGIGEEVFFRGFLQGALGNVINPWIALALVSVLFGVIHWVSSGYALVAGLIGLYLGTLLLVTGNLFVAIAVHALFDFGAILMISRMLPPPATEPEETSVS